MAAPRPATVARSTKPRFSRPYFQETLVVNTHDAQQTLGRQMYQVQSALYALDVILRIIGSDDEMNEVEALVTALLTEYGRDLAAEQDKMQVLVAQHGVSRVPSYESPRTFTVRVYSPQMGRYCALARSLDQFVSVIDTLWMNGVLGGSQRVHGSFAWRRKLLRLGREIIAMAQRARAAADRQGHGADVEAEMGPASNLVRDDAEEPAIDDSIAIP